MTRLRVPYLYVLPELTRACAANAFFARTVCYVRQLLSAAATAAIAVTAAAATATATAITCAARPTGAAAAGLRQRVYGNSAGRSDLYG
jgi:2-methylaconitate cis-trans-isomerase PrpF